MGENVSHGNYKRTRGDAGQLHELEISSPCWGKMLCQRRCILTCCGDIRFDRLRVRNYHITITNA